jgi:ankyrin repeat protein
VLSHPMTSEWKDAIRRGAVDDLQHLHAAGVDVDARDEHGQTALMLAAVDGHGPVVEWLIRQGANLYHTAKYGLSALMLSVVNGHVDVVRLLVRAGADHELQGTGAPGFAAKTALDLAIARAESEMVDIVRARAGTAE